MLIRAFVLDNDCLFAVAEVEQEPKKSGKTNKDAESGIRRFWSSELFSANWHGLRRYFTLDSYLFIYVPPLTDLDSKIDHPLNTPVAISTEQLILQVQVNPRPAATFLHLNETFHQATLNIVPRLSHNVFRVAQSLHFIRPTSSVHNNIGLHLMHLSNIFANSTSVDSVACIRQRLLCCLL